MNKINNIVYGNFAPECGNKRWIGGGGEGGWLGAETGGGTTRKRLIGIEESTQRAERPSKERPSKGQANSQHLQLELTCFAGLGAGCWAWCWAGLGAVAGRGG